MPNLPIYVSLIFGLTTLLAAGFFYAATNRSKGTLALVAGWLAVQSAVALSGFYTKTDVLPPRCVLLFWPPVILIIALFCLKRGRAFLDQLDPRHLTLLHSVRLLTALVFHWLYLGHAIPQLLTVGGRNLDVLAGLTAPAIYYFGFIKKCLGRQVMRAWNLIGLGLLLNLVVNAILSGPFPFQQFAFEQPDIAFLYFPFIWMTCGIVPLLLLAHLAALWQLRPPERQVASA